MSSPSKLTRIFLQEDLNFLLTNRIPRRLATQFMGWFSRIEDPLVCKLSIGAWRLFTDVDLGDAATQEFRSLHDCFTRKLKEGARPIETAPSVLVSPCDAIVGACGAVEGVRLIQAKGFPYTLQDLLQDPELVRLYRDGQYVTLRLTSSMYHRFHAPHDLVVDRVTYISGDTWNTNPIALARVERLFCKNERALIEARLRATGHPITIVAVASILVASIRLHGVDVVLGLKHAGLNVMPCDREFQKGEEMGWFEMGSTLIVFAPSGLRLCDEVAQGSLIRVGRPLLRLP